MFPVISVLLFAIPAMVPAGNQLAFLLLPIVLFNVGWMGTQRIWYLRAFRGERLSRREMWGLTSRFFWPFCRLGLPVLALLVPIIVVGLWHPLLTPIFAVVLFVAIDFMFTFVTPWLAYRTPVVRQAFVGGVQDIRRFWPRDRLYVLVPPLALLLVGRLLPRHTIGSAASIVGTALSALVALWVKGAVARFFLRIHPVTGDGWVNAVPVSDGEPTVAS